MNTENNNPFAGTDLENTFDTEASILPPDEHRIKGYYMPNSRNSTETIEAWADQLSRIFINATVNDSAISNPDGYTAFLIDWHPLPQDEVCMINDLVLDFIRQSEPFILPSIAEAEYFIINRELK